MAELELFRAVAGSQGVVQIGQHGARLDYYVPGQTTFNLTRRPSPAYPIVGAMAGTLHLPPGEYVFGSVGGTTVYSLLKLSTG